MNNLKYYLSFLILFALSLFVSVHARAKYEPPDGKIYHGVGWHKQSQINYLAMFPDTNKPLLVQQMVPLPGTRGISAQKIINSFKQDHIIPDSQYMEVSSHFSDGNTPLDSAFAFTTDLDSCIDSLAKALNAHGKPIFLRIGLEMNGAWNGYTPWIFPKAFRKLVVELRARNVTNFATVWCYEPDAPADFADSTALGWKWYPGDDMVDWFSLDPFPVTHFNPSLPDSANGKITPKGKSELFLKFARQKGKPVYLNETTAHSAFLTPDSNDVDSVDGIHDWENWFSPWLDFLTNHPEIKAFNYLNLDWTQIEKWKHWGDARIEINTYIKNRWTAALSDEKFLHAGYIIDDPTAIQNDPSIKVNLAKPFAASVYVSHGKILISNVAPHVHTFSCKIYTIQGRIVPSSIQRQPAKGLYSIISDAGKYSSGLYIVHIETGQETLIRKLVLKL